MLHLEATQVTVEIAANLHIQILEFDRVAQVVADPFGSDAVIGVCAAGSLLGYGPYHPE